MTTSNSNAMARLGDIYQNVPLSNRNYFIDGNFDYWITASSAVAAGTFTSTGPMAWYGGSGTAGAATVSRNAFNGTDLPGMTSPATYYYSHQQTTAATSSPPSIVQHIENSRLLSGRSATFSCWLWLPNGGTAITLPGVSFSQFFGTGGSTSVSNSKPISWVVTTTPQRYSVRLDFPSTLGMTVGTNDYINFSLALPSGSTFTINTTQWQLEESSPNAPVNGLPTAFEYRGAQAELARVQRYYETGTYSFSAGSGSVGSQVGSTIPFKATKRAVPLMTVVNASTNNVSATPNTTATIDSFYLFHSATTANITGGFTDTWTADTRL
jgi:hypothetical protein